MAGERPPLPLRGLDGPAQPTPASRGGGAAGPDRVIVTTPLTDTVRTTSTTQRDVTRRPEDWGAAACQHHVSTLSAERPSTTIDRTQPPTVKVLLSRHIRSLSDRKSTRLNSSHANISYAVFCLKKTQ